MSVILQTRKMRKNESSEYGGKVLMEEIENMKGGVLWRGKPTPINSDNPLHFKGKKRTETMQQRMRERGTNYSSKGNIYRCEGVLVCVVIGKKKDKENETMQ